MTEGDVDRRPQRCRSPNVLAAAPAAGTAVAITVLASCGAPLSRPRHRVTWAKGSAARRRPAHEHRRATGRYTCSCW
jgi:hypothetical protein